MSRENVELAHRVHDAFNRRDLDAFLALMDADVQAVPLAAAIEGDYLGHDGIRRWWNTGFDLFPDWTAEVVEVRDLGDLTVAQVHTRGRGAGSDAPFDVATWLVAEWRDKKVVWWSNHVTEAEALEAVELRKQAMPRENVDIVTQVIEAFNRADLEACVRYFAPDIEWHDQTEFPGARIHHGHDGVLAHFSAAIEDMADLHADVKAARELGDHVMVRAVISGRGRASGVAVKRDAFHVYTLDGGWITRVEIFGSESEALEAVRLRD